MSSDADLLRAARRDPDAFRELYDRYAKRMFAFFARRTNDRQASLDLTAETFARAWLGRSGFRDLGGGSAGPWLFAIARRVLISSVEKRRLETEARRKLGLLTERDRQPEPVPEWLEGLDAALEALPPGQRRAVELRVVDGLSYEQLADGLGCSQTAARIRVSRGLAALRASMKGQPA
jgi:RNA polymerase sigma-70 factor (ECF subfamily)